MSKRMGFVVSVLFIVVIVLALAITRFQSDTSKSTGSKSTRTDIERRLGSDSSGNTIFEDKSGLYGVADSSDRIIIAPEWLELNFAGKDHCIASKRISGKLLFGCLDYEGNLVVPLIYRNIAPHTFGNFLFFSAEPYSDQSCVLYDEDMKPMFNRSWEKMSLNGDELILHSSSGTYFYQVSNSGLELRNAVISGNILDCSYTMDMDSRHMLENLDPNMLEEMCSMAERYISFAFTGSGEYLSDIKAVSKPSFTTLFPDEKNILSKKLTDISNIYIYPMLSDNGNPRYAAAITVKTELVYTDDEDKPLTLTDTCKAIVEFSGGSVNDLAAVSGSFLSKAPNYPKPEIKEEPTTQPESYDDTNYSDYDNYGIFA
ncbi:MAG: hypothetical protein IJM38_03400 [Ruminococcus sp.]|nr:hypothetical protein [Ruminococcus sp.]